MGVDRRTRVRVPKGIALSRSVVAWGAAALLVALVPPAAAQTVTAGATPHQDDLIAVRYKSLGNTGDKEIYLGVPSVGIAGNRTDVNVTWAAGANDVVFEYDPGVLVDPDDDVLRASVTNVNGTASVVYPAGVLTPPNTLATKIATITGGPFTLADLNLMQISVALRDVGATLDFTGVEIDGNPLGSGSFSGVCCGTTDWTVTGLNFAAGFTLTGTMTLSAPSTFTGGNEFSKIDILVGHLNECGNGILEPGGRNLGGEACDDGNTISGDCCSSTCTIETPPCGIPTATPSDTATSAPTPTETATAIPTVTPTSTETSTPPPTITQTPTATPEGICPLTPVSGCATPVGFSRALRISDKKDLITWRWRTVGSLTIGDLGNPDTTTTYALCIYTGSPLTRLTELRAPAGGTCATKPCWKSKGPKGWRYRDKDTTPNGIKRMALRTTPPALADLIVRARGVNVPVPPLPLTQPVRAQLIKSDGPECWQSDYSAPAKKNGSDTYLDKND